MIKELLITGLFERFQRKKEHSIEDYRLLLREYQEYEAGILFQIALLCYEDDDIDEALESLEKARSIYEELGFDQEKADVLSLIGDINLTMGNQDAALKCFNECLELYSDPQQIEEINEKIRNLEVPKPQEAVEVESKEDEEAEELETPDGESLSGSEDFQETFLKLNDVINLLEESDVYSSYLEKDKTVENIQEAYQLAKDLGDKKNQGILLLILGDKLLQEKRTRKSLELIHQALDIFGEINYSKGEAITYLFIGVISFILGDVENIKYNFTKAIEIFRSLNDTYAESVAIELINTVYES